MKLRRLFLQILFLSFLCTTVSAQNNFYNGGPTSPYYLTLGGTVYIITNSGIPYQQPKVQTFQTVYGGIESILAVSCDTTPCKDANDPSGSVRTAGSGMGGVYTLSGVPTGLAYQNAIYSYGSVYDGTSNGYGNFFVEHLWGLVYSTDLYWQNPTPMPIYTGPDHRPTGIAYDMYDNSLWLSFGPDDYLSEYSMSGELLFQFHTDSNRNLALAFDSADNTLWMIKGIMGGDFVYLEQYSRYGALMQSGYVDGVPFSQHFGAGEMLPMPTPEPGTLIMMGTVMAGLGGALRRRLNA